MPIGYDEHFDGTVRTYAIDSEFTVHWYFQNREVVQKGDQLGVNVVSVLHKRHRRVKVNIFFYPLVSTYEYKLNWVKGISGWFVWNDYFVPLFINLYHRFDFGHSDLHGFVMCPEEVREKRQIRIPDSPSQVETVDSAPTPVGAPPQPSYGGSGHWEPEEGNPGQPDSVAQELRGAQVGYPQNERMRTESLQHGMMVTMPSNWFDNNHALTVDGVKHASQALLSLPSSTRRDLARQYNDNLAAMNAAAENLAITHDENSSPYGGSYTVTSSNYSHNEDSRGYPSSHSGGSYSQRGSNSSVGN